MLADSALCESRRPSAQGVWGTRTILRVRQDMTAPRVPTHFGSLESLRTARRYLFNPLLLPPVDSLAT